MAEKPLITFTTKETKKIAKITERLRKLGADVDKPLKQFAVYMLTQTTQTFDKGGRGEVKWAPLKPSTRAEKQRLGLSPKTLVRTGQLRSATRSKVDKKGRAARLVIFNPVEYAIFHQEGTKRMKKRPVLFFTRDDRKVAVDRFDEHLNAAGRKAARVTGVRS